MKTCNGCISAGYEHTVGLRSDGTVLAIGSNKNGQCDVKNWDGIIAVAAGNHHTVGLRADGTVVSTKVGETKDWKSIKSVSVGLEYPIAE